jgi:hypothetical protein
MPKEPPFKRYRVKRTVKRLIKRKTIKEKLYEQLSATTNIFDKQIIQNKIDELPKRGIGKGKNHPKQRQTLFNNTNENINIINQILHDSQIEYKNEPIHYDNDIDDDNYLINDTLTNYETSFLLSNENDELLFDNDNTSMLDQNNDRTIHTASGNQNNSTSINDYIHHFHDSSISDTNIDITTVTPKNKQQQNTQTTTDSNCKIIKHKKPKWKTNEKYAPYTSWTQMVIAR